MSTRDLLSARDQAGYDLLADDPATLKVFLHGVADRYAAKGAANKAARIREAASGVDEAVLEDCRQWWREGMI